MVGERFYEEGSRRVRGLIELEVGNLAIRLLQEPHVITEPWRALVDQRPITTTVELTGIESMEDLETTLRRLCTLLSFATFSPVRPVSFSFGSRTRMLPVSYAAAHFSPAIDTRSGKAVRQFLELTWEAFIRYEKERHLHELIEYLVLADRSEEPLEVKLLLVFVALENIKATYARSAGMVFRDGAFHSSKGRHGFEYLLRGALAEVGLQRGLNAAIKLRNEIVHFGLSTQSPHRLWDTYRRCQDTARIYLLRLLRFRGAYRTYASAGHRSILVRRRRP